MNIYFECVDPSKGMYRSYSLQDTQTIFEYWSLVLIWEGSETREVQGGNSGLLRKRKLRLPV